MIVVAIANTKGGVGKTTLTAALAVRASRDFKRVAMVDLDPQRSLVEWWRRRGGSAASPTIFEGVDSAHEAVERLGMNGWDVVFLDGPPAFLTVVQESIQAADFVLVPIKPSMVDLLATQDAIVLAREAGTEFMVVINDAGPREALAGKAQAMLEAQGIRVASTVIAHRVSHITSMTVGKSAAEVNGGKDQAAAAEIDALWKEVKAAATNAAKAKTKKAASA